MKTILLLLFIAFTLFSCNRTKNAQIKDPVCKIKGLTLDGYIIDSCEYIGSVYTGNSVCLAHKGNCKFCKKRDSLTLIHIINEKLDKNQGKTARK